MNEPNFERNYSCPEPRSGGFKNSCLMMFFGFALAGVLLFVASIIIINSLSSGIGNAVGQIASSKSNSLGDKYRYSFVSGSEKHDETILIVPINGIIISRVEPSLGGSQYVSAEEVCEVLRFAAEDAMIKGVIISIDSPGGEVVASDKIYRAILSLRKKNIPVIAQMGSLAASGGYYIAAGCDYIIANPMTTTGSIGVIMSALKYYDLMQKIGVATENYTSGAMKDMLSGSRPTNMVERALVQQHVNAVYDQFVQIVADGRPGLSVEKIKNSEIGDGRIFLGTQAKELGLVDTIGYEKDAELKVAELAKLKNYRVVKVQRSFSIMNLLMSAETVFKPASIALPGATPYKLEMGKLYFLPNFGQ